MELHMPDAFIGYETVWGRFSYKLYITGFLTDEDSELIEAFLRMIDVAGIDSFEHFKTQYLLFKAAVQRNEWLLDLPEW